MSKLAIIAITIEVGLYSAYQGIERLPLKSGGDRAILAQVEVGKQR